MQSSLCRQCGNRTWDAAFRTEGPTCGRCKLSGRLAVSATFPLTLPNAVTFTIRHLVGKRPYFTEAWLNCLIGNLNGHVSMYLSPTGLYTHPAYVVLGVVHFSALGNSIG